MIAPLGGPKKVYLMKQILTLRRSSFATGERGGEKITGRYPPANLILGGTKLALKSHVDKALTRKSLDGNEMIEEIP